MRFRPIVRAVASATAALAGVLLQPFAAYAQHAYESEILAYEAQDRASPPPLGSVVVTGSSTIRLWSTIRTDLAPLDVIPRGFGGSTTDDLDYYLDRIVLVYQPRAVVIYSGDNDISGGRSAQYVADRIAGILARISGRLPAARVYVISVKPSPSRWSIWPVQSTANQLLAAICATDARYTFINAATPLLGTNGQPKPEYYVADGLHLTAAGYLVWTNAIRPVLLPQQLIPLPVDTAPPTTPTGLIATPASASRIDLRWNAAADSGSGLAGYSVLRNGQRVGNTTTLTYSDTGLTSNTLYIYTVTAFDRMSPNRNESPQSASSSATTSPGSTPAPTVSLQVNPSSVAIGSSTQLSWSSTNATSCSASGGWSGAKATSGSTTSGSVFANSTFTLTCTGAGGTATDSKAVTIIPVPTVTLTASPSSVATGSATQLSWSSANASSCSASGGWSGTQATSGSAVSASLSASATFTLTCTGASGTASDSKSVTVVPAPTVSLNANPSSVASGSTTQLSWSSTNASSCAASGGWSGAKNVSGSASSAPITAPTTFTLTCQGTGGSANDSKSVTVIPAPTASLTANPSSVASGATTQLSWSSTNASSCAASGGWSGVKNVSGSVSSAPLTAATSFALTCTGAGGNVTVSSAVTVVAPPPPPPAPMVSLNAASTSLQYGGVTQLSWTGTDATSCHASGGWDGNRASSGTESTAALTADTMFVLACSGPGGEKSESVKITVAAPAVPSATLSASPNNVDVDGTTQLSWSSSNATSCTASGGWSGSRALSGAESSQALTATTVFALACSGPGGTASTSAEVAVAHYIPIVTLSATPATVTRGDSARLSWTTHDATDCAASGSWNGQRTTAGDEQTAPLIAESSFSLDCSGPGGSAYATVTIKATAIPEAAQAATVTVTATSSGGGGALGFLEELALLALLAPGLLERNGARLGAHRHADTRAAAS